MTSQERKVFWRKYTPAKGDKIWFFSILCDIEMKREDKEDLVLKTPTGGANISYEFLDPSKLVRHEDL